MALRSTAASMTGASQPPPVEAEERQEAEDAPLLAADDGAGSSAAEAAERRNTYQPVTSYLDEFRGMMAIAVSTAISAIIRSGTQQVTIILVGHLGAAELGAVAMGSLWVNISGTSIIFGSMSSLDTLASQAYGAKNYHLVGLWTQRMVTIICCLCPLIFLNWWFLTAPIMEMLGIDEDVARMAQRFARIQVSTGECFT